MNQPYIIFADISADILPSIAEENEIRFIRMNYSLGDEQRVCSHIEEESFLKKFYDGQRGGDMTKTSQITPQNYIDAFRPLLEEGKSILYLSLSSGLSNTYNSSCIAANELNEEYQNAKVICVDSLSATGGTGLLLEKAIRNRKNGMSLEENAAWLEENRLRLCHWFMVEDLMYLKRGGRLSAATAMVGTVLNIKPILKIDDNGKLVNFAKSRGMKAALKQLADYYKETSDFGKDEIVYILHADNREAADALEQSVKEINPDAGIRKMMLSPVIGAHTGPGMCAIVHFGKRND